MKNKHIKKVILSIFLLSLFTNSTSAIEKFDERYIDNKNLEKDICSHIDIITDRKQTYPCKNFTSNNIKQSNHELIVSNPDNLLSIGDGGICRIIDYKTGDIEKKNITIEYPNNTVLVFSDMEKLELYAKNGEIVNMNTIIAKAHKVKITIYKDGKIINPYTLLFNELYPRGGMKIPLFSQLDSRWKNDAYGDSSIYIAGCGPSSLAMIYSYFEESIITPEEVVKSIGGANSKYMISGQGSAWSLMTEDAKKHNLKATVIKASEIKENLKNNKPIIALMGNGYFTNSGHYIVLRGIDKNGNILVNDPADFKQNYKKSFSVDLINKQCKNLWAYEKISVK